MWLVAVLEMFSRLKLKPCLQPPDNNNTTVRARQQLQLGRMLDRRTRHSSQLVPVRSGRKTESSWVVTGCVSARCKRASHTLLEEDDVDVRASADRGWEQMHKLVLVRE